MDGLLGSFELVPEKTAYRLGERVGVRIHFQKVRAESIRTGTIFQREDEVLVDDVNGLRQSVSQSVDKHLESEHGNHALAVQDST